MFCISFTSNFFMCFFVIHCWTSLIGTIIFLYSKVWLDIWPPGPFLGISAGSRNASLQDFSTEVAFLRPIVRDTKPIENKTKPDDDPSWASDAAASLINLTA